MIGFGVIASFSQPSYAQSTTFFCGASSDGTPTTFANTPRGAVSVVKWTSDYFTGAGYSPEVRCQEVSSRFQRLYSSGQLNFITAGYLNGQPAICAGNSNPPCTSEKLLFTLKPGSNAAARIQNLFNLRSGASSTPLYESTRDGGSESSTVDFNQFLQQAPVVQSPNSSPQSQPNSVPVNPNQPKPQPGGIW
jgi:hypothetical protein